MKLTFLGKWIKNKEMYNMRSGSDLATEKTNRQGESVNARCMLFSTGVKGEPL